MKMHTSFFYTVVYTGCGDAIVRCFEARSGIMKRAFKSHALAINCIEVLVIQLGFFYLRCFFFFCRLSIIDYLVDPWMDH